MFSRDYFLENGAVIDGSQSTDLEAQFATALGRYPYEEEIVEAIKAWNTMNYPDFRARMAERFAEGVSSGGSVIAPPVTVFSPPIGSYPIGDLPGGTMPSLIDQVRAAVDKAQRTTMSSPPVDWFPSTASIDYQPPGSQTGGASPVVGLVIVAAIVALLAFD